MEDVPREISILWTYLDIRLLFSSYVYLICNSAGTRCMEPSLFISNPMKAVVERFLVPGAIAGLTRREKSKKKKEESGIKKLLHNEAPVS